MEAMQEDLQPLSLKISPWETGTREKIKYFQENSHVAPVALSTTKAMHSQGSDYLGRVFNLGILVD
ncbi:hypothetical protein Mapa_015001 [Marchantia paleacea]|nr:hypothetical protein Mapa_015001 [Marchantia paleacea]